MRWIVLSVGVLGVLAAGFWAAMNAVFAIQPGSEAVVSRGDAIHRVLGSGVHIRVPFLEQVVIYQSFFEREARFDASFEVAGCPAHIGMIYRIGDVAAFHEAGANPAVLQALEPRVQAVLADVPAEAESPSTDAQTALNRAMREELVSGLEIMRMTVDLGDCGPQQPRIELRREVLPGIETVGELGAERVGTVERWLQTSDGVRLDIQGVVPTYDIVDAARFEACFRSTEIASPRLAGVASRALLRATGARPFEALGDIAEAMPETMRERLGDRSSNIEEECGIAFGAVDFSAAVVERVTEINCDETPEEPECASAGRLE